MSDWIEKKGGGEIDQILEGHGTQFVVRFVSYSQPQCWRIKESPFLLDVHKSFVNLGEAKEYCERRYQELFGQRDEITRLRADLAAVTEERDYVMTEGLFSADQIRILKTERDAAIAERDRMLEALRPIVPSKVLDEEESTLVSNRLLNDALDAYLARSRHDDDETPRAALEGVTEPATGDSNA